MCKFPIKIYRKPVVKDDTPIWHQDDIKTSYYLVPCGRCMDCIRRRKNDWYVRAREEASSGRYKQILWLSLTFRDDRLPVSRADISSKLRAFKDRLRKHLGYFPTHFFISERGGKDCDKRIHLHGFMYFAEEIRYNELRHFWEPFEGFCWIEPTESLKAITYCFKYAFKGIYQRLKGDNLPGYVWASLGFGNVKSPDVLLKWFKPNDKYCYESFITYDSKFKYAIPRYLIGKVIKYVGYKKEQSFVEVVRRTFELYFTKSLRYESAVACGHIIPKQNKKDYNEWITNEF